MFMPQMGRDAACIASWVCADAFVIRLTLGPIDAYFTYHSDNNRDRGFFCPSMDDAVPQALNMPVLILKADTCKASFLAVLFSSPANAAGAIMQADSRDPGRKMNKAEPWNLKLALLKDAPESIQQTEGWLEVWITSRMQVQYSLALHTPGLLCCSTWLQLPSRQSEPFWDGFGDAACWPPSSIG